MTFTDIIDQRTTTPKRIFVDGAPDRKITFDQKNDRYTLYLTQDDLLTGSVVNHTQTLTKIGIPIQKITIAVPDDTDSIRALRQDYVLTRDLTSPNTPEKYIQMILNQTDILNKGDTNRWKRTTTTTYHVPFLTVPVNEI